ncbi:MAG: 1-acyl-sn-glycerol-3-phosphate acyltransferase [Fimbriimonadales bacterium]
MGRLLYCVGRAAFRGLFAAAGGLEWVHEERVPESGPLIVAPNHLSFADPPAVGSATHRPLCFMAKKQLFVPVVGRVLRMVGAFPVDRGSADLAAIRKAQSLLRAGEAVLVFPEGTRGDGKSLGEPNQGVALLAKLTSAPVIPVAVVGSDRFLPRGAKLPRRAKISVVWGEPFTYASVAEGLEEKEARRRFALTLMERIRDLAAERGLVLHIPWAIARPSAVEQ